MDNELKKQTEKFLDKYGNTFKQLASDLTEMVDMKDGDSLFLSRHLLSVIDANITAVLGNDPLKDPRKEWQELVKEVKFDD